MDGAEKIRDRQDTLSNKLPGTGKSLACSARCPRVTDAVQRT